MKDEDDNIIPNNEDNNSEENQYDENQEIDDSEEIINVDAKHFEGQHFYENQEEEGEDVITKVTGMYKDWFLDYASYVILERAVPAIEDGFKPVQRRIMHSLKELDDGRYNKMPQLVGAFKTPTIRNVAITAPYMHNGVFKTLEEVVSFYNKGGGKGLGYEVENQTLPFDKLNLTVREEQALVAFMKTLTDKKHQ
jgi:hypothetical protein